MNYPDKRYSVGLDIHEEDFYGNIMTKQGQEITEGPVKYSEQGVQNFLGFLPSTDVIIAIEACGISRAVHKLLTKMGYEVVVANPKKTHDIAGKNKTDRIDAKVIALFGEKLTPKVVEEPSAKVDEMAAVVASHHNPPMMVFYNKLIQAGKPKKVAFTAVMRKIQVCLNAMVKHSKPWQIHYER